MYGKSGDENINSFDENDISVSGVLDRIVFVNEENGFNVVKIQDSYSKQVFCAVGNFIGLQTGENLKLFGNWVNDSKYGKQFKVKSYQIITPNTIIGIEKYLGSGLIPGIGPVIAKRIVNVFGLNSLDVIDNSPDSLSEVEGIGVSRIDWIKKAWQKQKKIRNVMVFLHENGVSTSFAVKIYKIYENDAIQIIKKDPYCLARDIFGIGFKTADTIAQKMGIPATSILRVKSGVLHFLKELSNDGHVCYPTKEYIEFISRNLGVEAGVVVSSIEELVGSNDVVLYKDTRGNEFLYLRYLYLAENYVASRLKELIGGWIKPINLNVDQVISKIELSFNMSFDAIQKDAIRRVIQKKVVLITGGPGTGKTTIIKGILEIMSIKKYKTLMCAPTGRAAKRITETTGVEAKTIHRLLEYNPHTNYFERNDSNNLACDVLIVDEFSMIDIVLFFNLLNALPPDARLVMVGDADQLPSVGPGNVLRDLIDSKNIDVVHLKHIFRQSHASQIIENAYSVNSGIFPSQHGKDFFFLEQNDPLDIVSTIKNILVQLIPQKTGMDPINDVQILSPMHRGILGVSNLNFELQTLLNPTGDYITKYGQMLRQGDKVMQIKNNYDLDVFNGDIGRIVDVNVVDQRVSVSYDSKIVNYEQGSLDEIVLAYACSVHKSQGSEYPIVIIPIHTQHYMMLKRNLLYTAITRGKKMVILVGTRKAVSMAVANNSLRIRFSNLVDKLGKERDFELIREDL